MKLKYLSISILLGLATNSKAQSLERQVTTCSGQSFTSAAGTLEFTVGETITGSMTNANGSLNNGFDQTVVVVTNLSESNELSGFKVYPNPTNVNVTIETETNALNRVDLYNSNGQLLMTREQVLNKEALDLSQFAEGTYYLKLNQQYIYKIVKTK